MNEALLMFAYIFDKKLIEEEESWYIGNLKSAKLSRTAIFEL